MILTNGLLLCMWQIHVNIWDPILCAHLGTCYVLKLAWWWLYEQPKHVATRDLALYLLSIEIVVSGRKYTYGELKFNTEAMQHTNLYFILNSYSTRNTDSLHYEDGVVNTVECNNICLLYHKYILRKKKTNYFYDKAHGRT